MHLTTEKGVNWSAGGHKSNWKRNRGLIVALWAELFQIYTLKGIPYFFLFYFFFVFLQKYIG